MTNNFKLVESASRDLEAAKLLYREDFFNQAVFHTQQSIEKVSKYLALDSDSIRFEELQRKIGHNAIEAFKIVIESKTPMLKEISVLRENDKLVTTNFLNLDKIPENIFEEISYLMNYNLINLNQNDLNQIVKSIKDIGSSLKSEYFDQQELTGMDITEFAEFLCRNHLLPPDQKNRLISSILGRDFLKDFLDGFLKDFLVYFPEYIAAILKMFLAAIVFTKHAVLSRYPDTNKNFDPAEFYNVNNPLVKAMPFFHRTIEDSIQSITRYHLTIKRVTI